MNHFVPKSKGGKKMAGDEENNKFEEELLDLKENCKVLV